MNNSHSWYVEQDNPVVIALGFSKEFRKTLKELARITTEKPLISDSGKNQPYLVLYVGIVKSGKRLPGRVIDALLEDLHGAYFGTLEIEGCEIVDHDDSLYCKLISEESYTLGESTVLNKYRTVLNQVLEPLVKHMGGDEFVPYITLGRGFRGKSEKSVGYDLFDTVPTSVAMGLVDERGIFHRYSWISDQVGKIERSSDWVREMK